MQLTYETTPPSVRRMKQGLLDAMRLRNIIPPNLNTAVWLNIHEHSTSRECQRSPHLHANQSIPPFLASRWKSHSYLQQRDSPSPSFSIVSGTTYATTVEAYTLHREMAQARTTRVHGEKHHASSAISENNSHHAKADRSFF